MEKALYHINQEYAAIANTLDENGGELTPELEQALKINKEELQVKSLNYIQFIGNRKAYINQIDEEIKRLQGMKKRAEKVIDRLKSNLEDAVKIHGEFETGTYKVGLRKSDLILIEDQNKIPNYFKKIKIEILKTEVKKAIKEGQNVPGASIQSNLNLSIK